MIRLSTVLWLALVACIGFAMFKVKYDVMEREDELAKLNRAIVSAEDSIHVLKAEWSFLGQPARLGELSRRFLDLAPLATQQLGQVEQIDAIAMRQPPAGLAVAGSSAAPAGAAAPPAHAIPAPAAKPAPPAADLKAAQGTRVAAAKPRTER